MWSREQSPLGPRTNHLPRRRLHTRAGESWRRRARVRSASSFRRCDSIMTRQATGGTENQATGAAPAGDAGIQTPVMRQYFAAKQAHPDCLMMCRIGDFYELFYDDATLASRELQLTLTARDREKKQPMCGVPYHAANQYIQRLLRKGYRIALCDQMEDPRLTKKIVRREVTDRKSTRLNSS